MKEINRKILPKNYKRDYRKKPVENKLDGYNPPKQKNNEFKNGVQKEIHRSSRTTFFYKYFLPIIWGLVVFIGGSQTWSPKYGFNSDWENGAPVMLFWVFICLLFLMFRLQRVSMSYENITIKTAWKKKNNLYNDIEWISQSILIKPTLIRLKYRNKKGRLKRLLIIPSIFSQSIISETDTTRFIRQRIVSTKPEYSKKTEPSRFLPFILLTLPIVPIILVVKLLY